MQKSPEDGVTAPLLLTRTNSEPLHTHALHGTWTLTVAERVGELLNCSTAFTPSISFTPSTPYSPSPPLVSGQGYLWLSHRDPGAASWPLALHSFQRWRGLVGAEQQEAGETWTQAERRATRERAVRAVVARTAAAAAAAARSCGSDCVGSKRVSGTKHSSALQLCVLLRTPSSVLHRGWSRSSPASWVQFHSVR